MNTRDNSFIYNDFIKQLLKNAQQAAPAAGVDRAALVDQAKSMIDNLENQLGSFTADKDQVALHTANLTNLDKLFIFLSDNNIKKGGYPIVVRRNGANEAEFFQYDDKEKAQYSNYPDVDTNPEYHVNKNLLIDYLNELLSKNDPLLNALLKQRINDANSQLELNFDPTKPQPKLGPDGKPLVIDESKDKASSSFTDNGEQAGQSGQGAVNSPKRTADLLLKITTSLPFDIDYINFNKMQDFLKLYQELVGAATDMDAGRKGAVTRNINNAMKAMNEAWTHTDQSISTFPAKGTADLYEQIVKQPGSQHFVALIDRLKAVLMSVKYVVDDLWNSYKERGIPNLQAVQQQVVGTGSIFQQNWNNLMKLQGKIGQVKK